MATKKYTHGLPQYVSEVKRNGTTLYKYQRRVPKSAQPYLDKKKWDLSLGSDLLQAIIRALGYREHHDRLLAALDNPDQRENLVANLTQDWFAEQIQKRKGTPPVSPHWSTTGDFLIKCSEYPPAMEREALAVFAHTAFGDSSYIAALELSPMIKELAQAEKCPPPTGDVDKALYDGLKSALVNRLRDINASSPLDPKSTINSRLEEFITYRAVKPATARGYRTRIRRFVDFAGNLPLDQITAAKLRQYRDALLNEMSRSSVAQYIAPIRAIFKWAIKEEFVADNPIAKIELPRNDKSIEETKWQAFNYDEIATVWDAVLAAWGHAGTSQLSSERKASFLMAFRVMLWTGLRPNEVFKLEPRHVFPDRIEVKKTKTSAQRTLPLAAPIGDFHKFLHSGGMAEVSKLKNPSAKMSNSFTKIIRAAGLKNDRHVLYSLKDTMLDRLEALDASENIQRTIIGHVTGRGALRNYKTAANTDQMRHYLDKLVYCRGLP